MNAWHLRATVLPDDVVRDLWFEEDRISLTPIPGARTLHEGGFVVPGLVDTHTHPGTAAIGEPLDDDQLRADAAAHLRTGTALIRVPGSASRLPDWFTDEGGYEPSMPAEVVAAATTAAHDAGGRVAVHTQSAEGGRSAVRAGVDSIEHGMHLPLDLLQEMAAAGMALVPTATTFHTLRPQMSAEEVPPALREWFTSGVDRHAELVAAAAAAGVTVLAGTDLPPGSLTQEIQWLAEAGLSASQALAAGSWQARQWLGLPGVEHGAPADLLILVSDPRDDLAVLDRPEHVVVRGRLVG